LRYAMFLLAVMGCRPEVGLRASLVTSTKIIAVRAEPAEVSLGEEVALSALVVSPTGPVMPPIAWSMCRTPKPFTIDDVIAPACLGAGSASLGQATSLTATVPFDACRLFGPDLPPTGADGQRVRPRDPDATGGYYQPFVLDLDGAQTAMLERMRCALVGASAAEAALFAMRYQPNQNPELRGVSLSVGGAPVDPAAIPVGAAVTIVPQLGELESYIRFDLASGSVVDEQETVTLSYFITAGELDADRGSTNVWHAPPTAGPEWLWLVARDSRGGTSHLTVPVALR